MSPPAKGDRRRASIAAVFALSGVVIGAYFSRLAQLQSEIGLTEAELGVALVGMSTGVFLGSLGVSTALEREGTRRILLATLPVFAAAPLAAATLANGAVSLFAVLAVFGLAFAGCNIAMNVEADRVEAVQGRRLLNYCHAIWAVGFLAATLSGTGAVAAGIPPAWHFAVIFVLAVAAVFVIVFPLQAAEPRPHRGDGPRRRIARPTAGVFLIMGFAISGMWLEGTTRNWSVIYLRDVYEPAEWVATTTLPAIVVFQVVGRLLADRLIERFGPVLFARALTLVTFAGLLLVVTGGSIVAALAGFALIGFGISTVHPQALSAAARLGDRPSSENVAALQTLQTMLGVVSPPLIGAIATAYGIGLSFAMLLPLPLLALYFARYLARG
ncbi:MAG: MFS transporter [Hyphomicrobiales bacterium]|nr:MFS transporter [Hyphomicrobiales bacterium]